MDDQTRQDGWAYVIRMSGAVDTVKSAVMDGVLTVHPNATKEAVAAIGQALADVCGAASFTVAASLRRLAEDPGDEDRADPDPDPSWRLPEA